MYKGFGYPYACLWKLRQDHGHERAAIYGTYGKIHSTTAKLAAGMIEQVIAVLSPALRLVMCHAAATRIHDEGLAPYAAHIIQKIPETIRQAEFPGTLAGKLSPSEIDSLNLSQFVGDQSDLRCGKVILVVGPCEDVDQANGATALAQQPVVARENAQSSGSRRFQNSPPHRQ